MGKKSKKQLSTRIQSMDKLKTLFQKFGGNFLGGLTGISQCVLLMWLNIFCGRT